MSYLFVKKYFKHYGYFDHLHPNYIPKNDDHERPVIFLQSVNIYMYNERAP
jgi:hypothetical protein